MQESLFLQLLEHCCDYLTGSLCAQHCLNNLLQGEYFTPVDLSSIAQQLDEEERIRMAEGGVLSEEYRTFLQQPSGNMDDSGFFSIQWFNLNSLLTGPELISDTYLALFLAQLQQEGYSIFVIRGNLPECEADQILEIMRVEQQHRPKLIGEDEAQTSSGQRYGVTSSNYIVFLPEHTAHHICFRLKKCTPVCMKLHHQGPIFLFGILFFSPHS
uniref:ubiquitinyl hydrolase 1 n=1 Tax=Pygocentrus nattereri TaxID=42514 RepID=A0AAR2KBA5_PYGNA